MFGAFGDTGSVARVIQVALTPIFLLSGIGSLLGVFSTRLARVADRVDDLTERIEVCTPAEQLRLKRRLRHLRRRSHMLDAAVIMGATGGAATCLAALLLFVGTLSDRAVVGFLLAAFGFALLCTIGALSAFLSEMLMASRGLRDQAARAHGENEGPDAAEPEINVGGASTQ